MDPRAELSRLASERGTSLAWLSERLLGRNPAYLQQFVRRGSPRRLAEDDRRLLAQWFGVDEGRLGRPTPAPAPLRAVRRLDVRASAGPGRIAEAERVLGERHLPQFLLDELGLGPGARLAMVRAEGDSMLPTIASGDMLLVDEGDAAATLRRGVYLVRLDDVLLVKRVARLRGAWVLESDNPDSAPPPADALQRGTVIGRVVWMERRL